MGAGGGLHAVVQGRTLVPAVAQLAASSRCYVETRVMIVSGTPRLKWNRDGNDCKALPLLWPLLSPLPSPLMSFSARASTRPAASGSGRAAARSASQEGQ